MIDTHCHLSYDEFEDLDSIINEMKKLNIIAIVNGCEIVSNSSAIELSKKYYNIYAAIGFHPEEIDNLKEDYINYIEKNKDNIVAIGEIGLDYHWRNDKEKQIEVFENQLMIAEKYNIPVIVHSRDAITDTYNILKKYKVRGTIHAFSGSYEMAKNFINLGFKLGIGGVLTFKNCNLKEVLKRIEITDIVLETDSPYMAPEPVRGRVNTPINLKYIVSFISKVYGISEDDVKRITTDTASSLFDLGSKI